MSKVVCFGCAENISLAEFKSVLEFPKFVLKFVKYFLLTAGGTNQVIRLSSFNSVISFFSRRVFVYSLFTLNYTQREIIINSIN